MHRVAAGCRVLCSYSMSRNSAKPRGTLQRDLKENSAKKCQAHHIPFLVVLAAATFVLHTTAEFCKPKPT